jgi:hypothetical protein
MKSKSITVYEAFDGTRFDREQDCRAHEREHAHLALVGLTTEQVIAIGNGDDTERALLIEYVGDELRRRRLERGDRLRAPRRPNGEAPPASDENLHAREPEPDPMRDVA